jgi:hypothetical protein
MKAMVRRWLRDVIGKRGDSTWRSTYKPDLSKVSTIALYHINGKIGDSAYLSLLGRQIINKKNVQIIIFTSNNLVDFWRSVLPEATIVGVCLGGTPMLSMATIESISLLYRYRGKIDVAFCLDSGDDIRTFIFLRILGVRILIGSGKDQYRIFDISIPECFFTFYKKPALDKVRYALQVFEIDYLPKKMRFHLPVRVFLNTYGASETRTFSSTQIIAIVKHLIDLLGAKLVEITVSLSRNVELSFINELKKEDIRVTTFRDQKIHVMLNKITNCNICITPDTGVSHIAAIQGVSTLVFYEDCLYNPIVWRPDYDWVSTSTPSNDISLNKQEIDVICRKITEFIRTSIVED